MITKQLGYTHRILVSQIRKIITHVKIVSPEIALIVDINLLGKKNPTGEIEGTTDHISNPELYKHYVDEQGRQIPCIEWWEEFDGFDVAELSYFEKCDYCKRCKLR